MKIVFRWLIACFLSINLASCAYVEFSRKYQATGNLEGIESEKISTVLERYFKEKGLAIIKKYQVLHPDSAQHLVFEIPRAKEYKSRDPNLRVTILMNNLLIIEHHEWFLSVIPFPGTESHLPNDYIAPLQHEIEAELKNKLGLDVAVSFVSKSYY